MGKIQRCMFGLLRPYDLPSKSRKFLSIELHSLLVSEKWMNKQRKNIKMARVSIPGVHSYSSYTPRLLHRRHSLKCRLVTELSLRWQSGLQNATRPDSLLKLGHLRLLWTVNGWWQSMWVSELLRYCSVLYLLRDCRVIKYRHAAEFYRTNIAFDLSSITVFITQSLFDFLMMNP